MVMFSSCGGGESSCSRADFVMLKMVANVSKFGMGGCGGGLGVVVFEGGCDGGLGVVVVVRRGFEMEDGGDDGDDMCRSMSCCCTMSVNSRICFSNRAMLRRM